MVSEQMKSLLRSATTLKDMMHQNVLKIVRRQKMVNLQKSAEREMGSSSVASGIRYHFFYKPL
jgi:hypothetical protein